MEVYCQSAKNFFEAAIFHCIKYFKRTMSDIYLRTLYLGSGIAEGGDKLGQTVLDAPWRRINTLCNLSKTDFNTETLTKNA